MTIGMFAVSSTSAAVFTTNTPGSGDKVGHINHEPLVVLELWENPCKSDLDDDGNERYCDMYRVLTSLGLGWMNEPEVQVVRE